jgi:hypothetical protein
MRHTIFFSSKAIYPFSFIVATLFLFFACQKKDFSTEANNARIVEKFLALPANADPLLVIIVADLRKKNSRHSFIAALAKEQGFPAWSKAILNKNSNQRQSMVTEAVSNTTQADNTKTLG